MIMRTQSKVDDWKGLQIMSLFYSTFSDILVDNDISMSMSVCLSVYVTVKNVLAWIFRQQTKFIQGFHASRTQHIPEELHLPNEDQSTKFCALYESFIRRKIR